MIESFMNDTTLKLVTWLRKNRLATYVRKTAIIRFQFPGQRTSHGPVSIYTVEVQGLFVIKLLYFVLEEFTTGLTYISNTKENDKNNIFSIVKPMFVNKDV